MTRTTERATSPHSLAATQAVPQDLPVAQAITTRWRRFAAWMGSLVQPLCSACKTPVRAEHLERGAAFWCSTCEIQRARSEAS